MTHSMADTRDNARTTRRPAGRSDPSDRDRQAARADVGAAVPPAGDGQAGRRRPCSEGTRRHGHDLAAPAVDRVPGRGVMSIFLLLMGLFINAPLEDLANGNITPAVAKAPWYFLGLQELLDYFHPVSSGVIVPTFVLVGAALIPYVDRRNSSRDASLAAEDSGRAVQPVLRPRARRHVRRHLLPRPGLQLRDPVRDHERPPLQSLIIRHLPRISQPHEQLPRRSRRPAEGAHEGSPEVAPPGTGAGHLAPASAAPVAGRRRRPLAGRGHGRHARIPVAEPVGRLRRQGRDRHASTT